MVVHTCNPSTQEVKAEGSQGQPGLHSENLSQREEKKKSKPETSYKEALGGKFRTEK
jgi:hypothetical protein